MEFKMAKGSLFAVLLRSPWWYSVLIAFFAIAVSVVLAEGRYLLLGVTAALPFLGIAGYSAYNEFQRPGKKRVLEVEQQARKMPAAELAKMIADNYEKINFDVIAFKGDAAEFELERGKYKYLVSCKRFKAAKTGIEPLKKLIAAGEKHKITGYLYVTLGEVSANALVYAQNNNIEFVYGEALADYFNGEAKCIR